MSPLARDEPDLVTKDSCFQMTIPKIDDIFRRLGTRNFARIIRPLSEGAK